MSFFSTIALAALLTHGADNADKSSNGTRATPPPADLIEYVRKPDPTFSWKLVNSVDSPAGKVYNLELVSQTWQEIAWQHSVQVFLPPGSEKTETAVLWNQGGSPEAVTLLLGSLLARKIEAPVIFLYGVPKQPLFGGKTEDALIAETFVRYLETEDSSWPLLFPMVKSVTATMDAVQELAKKEFKDHTIKDFVITGASKRGWTSWLTAASQDSRVKGIAPLVIDTLNMRAQMPNQIKSFGKFSLMIKDYTERKLVPFPESPAAEKLWSMVDPWVYRDRLTVPKMIINGTNDPYWALDALNFYWNDLPGQKHVLYVPNAGHGLDQRLDSGAKSRDRAVNTLSAFCRSLAYDEPMPKLNWQYDDQADCCQLKVESSQAVKVMRLWTAQSKSRDFRSSQWASEELEPTDSLAKVVSVKQESNQPTYKAFFIECEYGEGDSKYTLSTQLRILEPGQ